MEVAFAALCVVVLGLGAAYAAGYFSRSDEVERLEEQNESLRTELEARNEAQAAARSDFEADRALSVASDAADVVRLFPADQRETAASEPSDRADAGGGSANAS